MKKSRFTETRIVSMLKQADAGVPVKEFAAKAGSAWRPTTSGRQGTAVWRRPT